MLELSKEVEAAVRTYFVETDVHENLYEELLCAVEKPLIRQVLRFTQGNQTRSAGILGISRSTFIKKMRKYNF